MKRKRYWAIEVAGCEGPASLFAGSVKTAAGHLRIMQRSLLAWGISPEVQVTLHELTRQQYRNLNREQPVEEFLFAPKEWAKTNDA
jgi:hypothetical protein